MKARFAAQVAGLLAATSPGGDGAGASFSLRAARRNKPVGAPGSGFWPSEPKFSCLKDPVSGGALFRQPWWG